MKVHRLIFSYCAKSALKCKTELSWCLLLYCRRSWTWLGRCRLEEGDRWCWQWLGWCDVMWCDYKMVSILVMSMMMMMTRMMTTARLMSASDQGQEETRHISSHICCNAAEWWCWYQRYLRRILITKALTAMILRLGNWWDRWWKWG